MANAAPTDEQLQVIRRVLMKKKRPLSWESLGQELEKYNCSFSLQSVQYALCKKAVPGILNSRDFITLDTPRNVGLLKLQLVVAVNEEINGGQFSKANHYFHVIASDEERKELGNNEDTLTKSILEFGDIFIMPSLSSSKDSYKMVQLKTEFVLLHRSFFAYEKDSQASAIHKLKYFLFLCHGSTGVRSAFEFSRCLLAKEEKFFLARNSVGEFKKAVKPLIPSIGISGDTVTLTPSLVSSQEKRTKGDDQGPRPKKTLDVFDEKDMALFKDILQEGPLSWKVFLSRLESRRPNTYSVALREMFRQSQPDGLIHSPDFVSLNDVKSTGLAKLHFIVFVNNKSEDVSLYKVSYHFSVFGSEEEREEFGRNSDGILQSLLNYKDVFLLPLDGGNQRSVKCGPRAVPFNSFFQLQGKSEESFNHKLKYFVNLCGGTCTMSSAFEFSRNLLSSDEKRLFKCNKESFFELVTSQKSFTLTTDKIQLCKSHLWSTPLEAAALSPVVLKIPNSEIPEERKSKANKKLRSIQCILEQQKQAVALWRNLDGNLYTCEERSCWVREFIDIYLPTLEPFALICTEEFVSLNTPEGRAFLKVCLMASMSIKCKKTCTIETLFKQAFDIGSVKERRAFYSDFESYVKSYPSVFVITEKSLLEKVVQSGSDMPLFEDLFGVCTDHGEESCLRCLLEFFLYLSGGVSHFSRAFAFVKLTVDLGEVAAKSITKMEESDFETLVKSCDRILLSEELILTLVCPLSSCSVASKERKETSEHTSEHSCDAPWPIGRWKYNEEGSDKKASVSPPSQEKLLALPAPSEASTASSSIRQNDDDQVQSTPEEDALSTTSSTISKSARKRANKKKKKEAAAALVSMTTKPKVDVYVQVIKDDLTFDQLIKKMQNHNRPIMSVVHSTDALVVVDWFGAGFILPVPKKGFVGSNRWSRMNHFFTDPHIVVVTFDLDTVGRFLFQRMSLKPVTVFDIKSGVWLMYPETENCMHTCNSVGEMCRHFGREGPDLVNAEIVGNLEFHEEQIQLDREELLSAVQSAAVLVPSVYSWILQELESRSALNELHTVTMEKLKLLDTKAIVDTTMSASIDSSTRTTPLPRSSTSSSSSVRSSHSYEWKNAMVPFTENSTSFSTSLPKKGIVPSQCLAPVIPPQDDWFSEELGEPPGIPVALESSYDQETYCLRKVDNSSIYPVPQEEAESYDSNLSNLTNELISQYSQSNAENIVQLLTLLGDDIFTTLGSELKDQSERTVEDLSEITLHVGRRATARFYPKTNSEQPVEVDASSKVTTSKDLEEIEKNDALTGFDDYNRCGVEGCLHNIRGMRNRKKKLIGLTVRVALPLLGCADMMYDIALSDKSTLILGRPGVGKTTLLRELARCLSDTEGNKVVVIDTCNEIAGDCDTPHFSIGRASRLQVSLGETSRSLDNVSESKLMRMSAIFITDGEAYKQTCVQVDSPDQQHQVITESAKNHNPDVVIIDLIELPSDVSAISRICKQGIKVIAGVSRDSVSSLIHDENLSQMFKVGDSNFLDDMSSLDSAGALAKSKLRPVFEALVEMKETDCWHIHDLIYTLSNVSNGQAYRVQERTRIGLSRRQPGWEQEILLREKVINPHNALH